MKSTGERGNSKLRFLDRYVGIPAVMMCGLWKGRRARGDFSGIKRVAFLKTAAIGDTVLLSAVIKDFKESYPVAHLTFFTAASNHEMAHLLPGVDRIIKLPVNRPCECLKAIRKSGSYDVWIDFGPWPRLNALFSFFSDSRTRIGFRTKGQARHYVYDIPVEHSSVSHELANYRNLLAPLKINGANLPRLDLEVYERCADRVTIHMFPGGYKSYLKEWPEENWLQLIGVLVKGGYDVYLTGAKADAKRAADLATSAECDGRVHVVAGKLDLRQTAELLKSSSLVISVNTGIMHLASALGCNLIALHGPTSVKRWGPLNRNSISLQSASGCSPCLNLGFEYKCNVNTCMENIPLSATVDAVRKFLHLPGGPASAGPPAATALECDESEQQVN